MILGQLLLKTTTEKKKYELMHNRKMNYNFCTFLFVQLFQKSEYGDESHAANV